MYTLLNDPVEVMVSFTRNKVRPMRMRWNEREYDFKQIHLVHTAREGVKRVFYFSLSDAANAFKLKLDPELLEWRLVEIYVDG